MSAVSPVCLVSACLIKPTMPYNANMHSDAIRHAIQKRCAQFFDPFPVPFLCLFLWHRQYRSATSTSTALIYPPMVFKGTKQCETEAEVLGAGLANVLALISDFSHTRTHARARSPPFALLVCLLLCLCTHVVEQVNTLVLVPLPRPLPILILAT